MYTFQGEGWKIRIWALFPRRRPLPCASNWRIPPQRRQRQPIWRRCWGENGGNILPLENAWLGCKIGWLIFRCYVSFREGLLFYEKKWVFLFELKAGASCERFFWRHFVGVRYSRHSFQKRSLRSRLGIILGICTWWKFAESISQVVFLWLFHF